MKAAGNPPVRRVRCPACGRETLYAAENPARPFCSPRCRSIDLGAWASESYRVDTGQPAGGTDDVPGTGSSSH
jgi:hypothetical protein